jgi:hypothetical protein
MLSDKQNYLDVLQGNIATVIKTSTATSEEAIDQRLMELQKEIISKANNKEAYNTIADEIFRLRVSEMRQGGPVSRARLF